MTAVVTDSYGLSSSSGRKTSRDGEVTISAECFESWEREKDGEREMSGQFVKHAALSSGNHDCAHV